MSLLNIIISIRILKKEKFYGDNLLLLALDLHSHSGYSGGVGKISLEKIRESMEKKGIDVFGTGDCLHPFWLNKLRTSLIEVKNGVFALSPNDNRYFVLQTEVVLTAPITKNRRKSVHTVLLFPSFETADKVINLFRNYGVKNTIGRPFITFNSIEGVSDFLFTLKAIDNLITIFPAHIMTPDGIFGSNNPITYLEDFFGDYAPHIRLLETGLSADPEMLEKIPQCRERNYISNSDCHSHAIHRIGREFTLVEVEEISYPAIVNALEGNGIVSTYEFNPREGKFYASGHRKGKYEHPEHFYSEDIKNLICPHCNKPFTKGVKHRIEELSASQKLNIPIKKERKFKRIIPLIEVIAYGLNIKTLSSKKVINLYDKIVNSVGSEISLWLKPAETIEKKLSQFLDERVLKTILAVHKGEFTFDPPGFDGEYGKLKIYYN